MSTSLPQYVVKDLMARNPPKHSELRGSHNINVKGEDIERSVGHCFFTYLEELFGKSCHCSLRAGFQQPWQKIWPLLHPSREIHPSGDHHMHLCRDDTEKEAVTQKKNPAEIVT